MFKSMSTDAKRRALFATGEILDSLHIPWWLEAGSCLGYIRGGDFIEWDYDIDLGIAPGHSDQWQDLIDIFYGQGWIKGSTFWTYGGFNLRQCFAWKNCPIDDPRAKGHHKPRVDIFYFYEAGDKWWMGAMGPTPDGKNPLHYNYFFPHVFPARLFADMKEVDFAGRKCLIPNPPEEYLEARYGKKWKKPQPHYHYWNHCKAIISIDEWQKLIALDEDK